MTSSRRIFLNIIATYGRSLLNVACGLFSARWVLEALGQQDFGLFGVVGGLVVFIEFLNGQFSGAVSRFYAVALGERKIAVDKTFALENCREWFSTAVCIHTVLPLVLMSIGYPLGEYALKVGMISIPPDRLDSCLWVWRFSCLNCLTAMLAAPMWAMYVAQQNIAEMSLYGVGQTLVRTTFIYYMTMFPGDWLAGYGFAVCLIATVPRFMYVVRAFLRFEECRLRRKALCDWQRIRSLCSFVTWESLAGIGQILKGQGMSVAVNNFLGARVNAAMSVGNQVAGESAALTGAMLNAFTPAIVTAYGAREYTRMRQMAFSACKFGVLLILVFAIPLMAEMDTVLRLWLHTPPPHTKEICCFMIVVFLIEKLSQGHGIAIAATGCIAWHRVLRFISCIVALFVVIGGLHVDFGVHAVGAALVVAAVLNMVSDVWIARRIVGLSILSWLRNVVYPVLCVGAITIGITSFPSFIFAETLVRVCITSVVSLLTFVVSVSVIGLTSEERDFVFVRFQKMWRVLRGKMHDCWLWIRSLLGAEA